MLRAADLFCGAGGTSAGAEATGGVKVAFALNHWGKAIQTHSANFPNCHHVNSRLETTSPSETSDINLLFASPECTHHSRARGGRPTSDQQRTGAHYVLPWIEHHRPSWVVIENVVEFKEWGPIGDNGRPLSSKKGATFEAWVKSIESMNYKVDFQELNAADFGAATSRNRLFIIARKGSRNPIFPEPTHSRKAGGELPGFGLLPWKPAADVIDWSIPCPSIFRRPRPLADKTLLRIEAGLRRFVGPFVAQWDNHGGNGTYTRDLSNPLATMTTKANMGVVLPYQVILRNNMDSADITDPLKTITAGGGHNGVAVPFLADVNHGDSGHSNGRTHRADESLGTITAKNGKALISPVLREADNPTHEERLLHAWRNWPEDEPQQGGEFALATGSGGAPRHVSQPLPTIVTQDGTSLTTPFILPRQGFYDSQKLKRCRSIDEVLPTITASHIPGGIVMPWLSHYYGTDNQSPVSDPVDTITTKPRHSLCVALCRGPQDWPPPKTEAMRVLQQTMLALGVCDIGFRMLSNPELSSAQGFSSDYIFHGTKADVTRQIGNSVSPAVAQAMTKAILSV